MIRRLNSFNTQFVFDEFDIESFDDGEEVEGFVHGVCESPSTLLARLRAGESVSVHMPGDPVDDLDFFDMADEADRFGGAQGPEDINVEESSTDLDNISLKGAAAPQEDPANNPQSDVNQD